MHFGRDQWLWSLLEISIEAHRSKCETKHTQNHAILAIYMVTIITSFYCKWKHNVSRSYLPFHLCNICLFLYRCLIVSFIRCLPLMNYNIRIKKMLQRYSVSDQQNFCLNSKQKTSVQYLFCLSFTFKSVVVNFKWNINVDHQMW